MNPRCCASFADILLVAVAGSAIKWLRDSMKIIKSADEINTLARSVTSTSGVYFVTAFSGLLAPYWDPGATGLLVGLTLYTTPAHIARATLEANAFQTRAVIDSMKLDSKSELSHLKVDSGMTNGDVAMEVLADVGGFEVARPETRESTALGSALLAGACLGGIWPGRRRLCALIRRVARTFCRDWGRRNVVRLGGVGCALLTAHAGG
jgi:glycerol kinase